MPIPAKTAAYLTKQGYRAKTVPHRKVFTAYDLAQTLRRPLATIAKTLLVKTEQGFTLAVLGANARLDLKKLKRLLQAKRLTIATERDMVSRFKVKPGAMTAFGKLHNVLVAVDARLAKVKAALFPSGSFTESLEVTLAQFRKIEQATVGSFSVPSAVKLQASSKAKPKKVIKRRTRQKSRKAKR